MRLLLILAQYFWASNQFNSSVNFLKHEFWKRSQSGVEHIAVEKNNRITVIPGTWTVLNQLIYVSTFVLPQSILQY